MSEVIIVDTEYMTLKYLKDKRIVCHTIHKPVSGQALREILYAGTETLIKYGASKWLSDDRRNGALFIDDCDWGFNDWCRRTVECGWKFWALVVPQRTSDAGSMIPLVDDLSLLGLRMMVFSAPDPALAWLERRQE
jgi:hypothetical protein